MCRQLWPMSKMMATWLSPPKRQFARCLFTKPIHHFHKTRKVLTNDQMIEFERKFLEQRPEPSPVNSSDYRRWLTDLCSKGKDTTISFERKFRKIHVICQTYNKILETSVNSRVPTKLTTDAMQELLELNLELEIIQQIGYLYDMEVMRWTEKEMRKQDVMKTKRRLEAKNKGNTSRIGIFDDNNQIIYGLWHNTMFTRIRPIVLKNYISRTRLKNAALFGQNLVIDFGFEEYLNLLSAKQVMPFLMKMFNFNKYHLLNPYNISFHNIDKSGYLYKLFNNYFHDKQPIEQYINLEKDSYLEHYDFNKLCYICPQAEEPLVEYDHNAVYIMPAVVNSRMDLPLSMTRIKMEGIKMRRLDVKPLKRGYHLELSNSLQILSHFRDYNDIDAGIDRYLPNNVFRSDRPVTDEDQEVIKRMFYERKIRAQSKAKIFRPLIDEDID